MTALLNKLGQKARSRGLRLLEGEADLPEQRMHLAFLFCAALACFCAVLFNVASNVTSPFYDLVLAATGVVLLLTWAYSRRRRYAQPAALLMCGVATIALLPLSWFNNQGMNGPSLMMFLVLAGYTFGVLLVKPWQRWMFGVIFLAVPYLLIAIEYRKPEWIDPYASAGQHALDTALTYSICVGLLIVLVSGVYRRFQSEQRIIENYAERLRESARRDSLTGLLNHGAFYSLVDARCAALGRAGEHAALLVYDLDYFKTTNDTYGHVYGDQVLRLFAQLLDDVAVERGGTAARCGGEEFAVFVPGMTRTTGEHMDNALRAACGQDPLQHGPVRFSGGASFDVAADATLWMDQADRALYAAKRRGRNQTVSDHRPE